MIETNETSKESKIDLAQAVAEYDYHALSVTSRMELTTEQVTNLVNELANYHAIYQPYFGNESQGTFSYHCLCGLLDPGIMRKSAAEAAIELLRYKQLLQCYRSFARLG